MSSVRDSELRSRCPLTASLDVVGDRWMLVVLRDVLIYGPVRFTQLAQADEGIATNVLTNRLHRLEAAGLIESIQYQARPRRYEYVATQKATDLYPSMRELIKWGQKHVKGVIRDRSPFDYFTKRAKSAPKRVPRRRQK